MPNKEKIIENRLTTFTHDLFLNNEYMFWRQNIKNHEEGIWHSLSTSLFVNDAPVKQLRLFDAEIYSNLVFNYVKAPDYSDSQMLMIQFTLPGSMWHSVVWHCPENN